jgi:hypothetical protein
MPPQRWSYIPPPPPVAVLANALLAALNGLWLLAPVALLDDLASALEVALAKAAGALLEGPLEEARGAGKAFVRRGLNEGVYRSDIGDVPPGEVLR